MPMRSIINRPESGFRLIGERRDDFRSLRYPVIDIIIVSATLQHNFIIGVALQAPEEISVCSPHAFSKFTLFCGNFHVAVLISQIAEKLAPGLGIVPIISDAEELVAAQYAQIERNLIAYAAVNIGVLGHNTEDIVRFSRT